MIRFSSSTKALLVFSLLLLSAFCFGLGETKYVSDTYVENSLVLVSESELASIYIDSNDHRGVSLALNNLQLDIERVTGKKPELVHSLAELSEHAVIVGTIGHSVLIDELVANGKLDVSAIVGQWEGFQMQVVAKPFEGVELALVIVGTDMRGTIYGSYDLSEEIGVSPWYWWADVPTQAASELYVLASTFKQQAPKVQYRGIFLNDESPALSGWTDDNFGDYNSDFYAHVFELLLRLKANFMWPAMWDNAFNLDDSQNMVLANDMGIVMSSSHHEPMMRAQKEWTWATEGKGNGEWNYNTNGEALREFWRGGVERNMPYESIITMGMRGDGDEPMSEQDDIALLERIVADQRTILGEVYNEDISEIPQVWTLYKEVQGYYEKGMRVDDDITLLWSDDNWGNIRHFPTPDERLRSGGAGVYYHFDYVGGPRSYRWINTTPLAKIWEQMNLAYHFDARKIWVVNVGDLKPMEYPIEYFLRLAWNPDAWPKERIQEFGQLWAEREFGSEYAEEIASLMTAYTRHNGRRKPELMDASTYSQLNYREADRISAAMRATVRQAEMIYAQLPAEKKDAFFQLVLHPVKASAIVNDLYNAVAKNSLYAQQRRASTNSMANEARALFSADTELRQEYDSLNNGKWQHFMDQSHIGYTSWANPAMDIMPEVQGYLPPDITAAGVAVEGGLLAWPDISDQELNFSQYGQPFHYMDVFQRGSQSTSYSLQTQSDWIMVSENGGGLDHDVRIEVQIDWSQLSPGKHVGSISIQGQGWDTASITINAEKFSDGLRTNSSGYIEGDGYISIEAANYSHSVESNGFKWQKIEQHGRTQNAMSPFPVAADQGVVGSYDTSFEEGNGGPYLEYELIFTSTGDFEITALFAPTVQVVPGRGLRYAIAIDDEAPQVVDILEHNEHSDWQESVRNGVRVGMSTHSIGSVGQHRLRIYMVDSALTMQKVMIDTGGLLNSYLGPEQSRRL